MPNISTVSGISWKKLQKTITLLNISDINDRFDEFQNLAIGLTLCVWIPTEVYPDTLNSPAKNIAETFAAENIVIPIQQMTLNTNAATGPLAISVSQHTAPADRQDC